MTFSRGHALLIGVGRNKYDDKWSVPITANDAQEIAGVLRDPRFCGYPEGQVQLLYDDSASRASILSALDELAGKVRPDDTVLLFYSGHGDYGDDGSYYLVSHDARIKNGRVVKDTGVSQEELLAKLKELKSQRLLMIFNACHSGEISPTLSAQESTQAPNLPALTAEALLATGSGRIIITACREGQYSYFVHGDPLTLFGRSLVDALQGKDIISKGGFVSAFDLYTALYDTVSAAVEQKYNRKQEPELTILKGVGPFAVALYRGATATNLSVAEGEEEPESYTAVRQVPEEKAKRRLQQIMQVYNQQITQSGGINFGQGNVISNQGMMVGGDYVGGDKVMGDNSTTTINTGGGSYTGGNVTTQGGDFVGRDKNVYGDQITASTVSGNTGIAIGRGTKSVVTYGTGRSEPKSLETLFQLVYQQIESSTSGIDKASVTGFVKSIQNELAQGDQANPVIISGMLTALSATAGSIHTSVVIILKDPAAGAPDSVRRMLP